MRATKLQNAFGELCNEIVERKINLYDTKYYSRRNIWGLYGYYTETDITILTGFISEVASSRNIYRILWDVTSTEYSSNGTCRYHIEEKEFEILFASQSVVDSLIEEASPHTDAERFVYSIYKSYKSGSQDEWGHTGC